jgi:hypothetical protein
MDCKSGNIDFQLPNTKTNLEFLQLSRFDRQKVIELGIKFLKYGNHYMQALNNEQWERKLDTIKEEKKAIVSTLQADIQREKHKIQKLIKAQNEHTQLLIEQAKTQVKQRFESELLESQTTLIHHKELLDIKVKENQTIYKQMYGEFEKKLQIKEKHWEERMDKMRGEYDEKLRTENIQNENTIIKTQNSTIIGHEGENFTFYELNRRFPAAAIEDTRKQAGRGDFIFKEKNFTMLIETKNYKNNVTKPEVDKFYRDIDINHDIQCGILMSLKSGICAREDFQLEIRDNKPILFLHNTAKNMKHIDLAIELFKLILKTDDIDLNNKEILDKLKNNIPIVKRNWNKIRHKIKKFEKDMMESVLSQESIFRSIFEVLKLKY